CGSAQEDIGVYRPAVLACIAREVNDYRFIFLFRFFYGSLVIVRPNFTASLLCAWTTLLCERLHYTYICGLLGRKPGIPDPERGSQQSGNQIKTKQQKWKRQHYAARSNFLWFRFVRKSKDAQNIEAAHKKNSNPGSNGKRAGNETPLPYQIGVRKEFNSCGQFNKSKQNFYDVHP